MSGQERSRVKLGMVCGLIYSMSLLQMMTCAVRTGLSRLDRYIHFDISDRHLLMFINVFTCEKHFLFVYIFIIFNNFAVFCLLLDEICL